VQAAGECFVLPTVQMLFGQLHQAPIGKRAAQQFCSRINRIAFWAKVGLVSLTPVNGRFSLV
jgi:hypothetical protein